MAAKRKADKAASEKKNAQLRLNYQKKKAEEQSGSGKIVPDDSPAPVLLAAAALPIVAAPAFIERPFRFKLGDSVETQPDTNPGLRGYHGEAINCWLFQSIK